MVLELVLSKIEEQEQLRGLFLKMGLDSLASILQIFHQGSTESKIASTRVQETIANNAESKPIIAENENLLEELHKLISPENESSVIEVGLSCLIQISMPKRARLKLVQWLNQDFALLCFSLLCFAFLCLNLERERERVSEREREVFGGRENEGK